MNTITNFTPNFRARINIKTTVPVMNEQEINRLIQKSANIGSARDTINFSVSRNPLGGKDIIEYSKFNIAGNSLEVENSYTTASEDFKFFDFFNKKLDYLRNLYESTWNSLDY